MPVGCVPERNVKNLLFLKYHSFKASQSRKKLQDYLTSTTICT